MEPRKSDEMAMNVEYSTTSDGNAFANKENSDADGQQFQANAPNDGSPMCDEAEVFCGMVVHQLTSGGSNDQKEEWHHGQLNAYNWAHEQLFEKK